MADQSYWVTRRGLTRRRLLGAGAGTGFSAAFLAACGGSNNNSGAKATNATNAANSVVASTTRAAGSPAAVATAAGGASGTAAARPAASPVAAAGPPAKRGGKVVQYVTSFPANLDIQYTSDTPARNRWGSHIYGHLVQAKGVQAPGPDYPSSEVVPDVALSYETPDQGITYTFKLNPKVKWHPPVSRQFVADDFLFSLQRFRGQGPNGKAAVNPEQIDVIDSATAPDQNTVVLKGKAPNALFLLRLADDYIMPLVPPEIEKAFDPAKTGVGTMGWIVDQVNRPQGWTLKRNPDWHFGPDRPYLDSMEFVAIQDPATALNQFKAGNLDVAPVIAAKDVPGIKAALPDVQVTLAPPGTAMPYIAFSSKDPTSPWNKDPRVRQALSMSIDRNSLWAAYYPNSDYTSNGLPVPSILYNNVIPTGMGPDWLDPIGPKSDPDVKTYFTYSPDNAKKLLSAAGFPDGITTDLHYTTGYGALFTQHAELVIQMVAKGGFKLNAKIDDFTSVFQPKTFFGDFDGLAHIYQGYGTPMEWIQGMFYPGSSRNQDKLNDPTLTKMIDDMLTVLDATARRQKIYDILTYADKMMYYVPGMLGAGPAINVNRGYMHNLYTYMTARSGTGFWDSYYWRD